MMVGCAGGNTYSNSKPHDCHGFILITPVSIAEESNASDQCRFALKLGTIAIKELEKNFKRKDFSLETKVKVIPTITFMITM